MPFESIDPATEEPLARFDALDRAGIRAALDRAAAAFEPWRLTSPGERAAKLLALADLLERGREAFGRLMTREMGKPVVQATAEIDKCAWVCRYYAETGPAGLAPEPAECTGRACRVEYQPLGAILAVMPWNFPFWQIIRCAAPTLTAGNTILLKHAPNVPQCAIAVEGLFARAGFPPGVFQNLFIEVGDIPFVLDHPIVQGASLTGSVRAGASLAAEAGHRIKKTVLELGGSDPFIVMESADLEAAVETAIRARMINSGQSCIAAKRFLVHEPVADEFERRFVEGVAALRVGDPSDPETDVGPLAAQVEASVGAGARLLTGGSAPEGAGWYYSPTVLSDIPPGSPAACEELFGPVASLFRVSDLEEAIARANETEYGLGAAIWTRDPGDMERAIRDVVAGSLFINGMTASDPRMPFGGVKRSGYGRELGPHALREFVNIKTVWSGPA